MQRKLYFTAKAEPKFCFPLYDEVCLQASREVSVSRATLHAGRAPHRGLEKPNPANRDHFRLKASVLDQRRHCKPKKAS